MMAMNVAFVSPLYSKVHWRGTAVTTKATTTCCLAERMTSSRTITFVTGNKNKLIETKRILNAAFVNDNDNKEQSPFELVSEKIDLPELQGTPEEIAIAKVRAAADRVRGPVIVEDTCLCFNALGGLPGPYVKHFMGEVGPAGLKKLLVGFEDHSGYAQCIFGYSSGESDEAHLFVGRVPGVIVEPRGGPAFGWDPIFQPDGYTETFAEMDKDVKSGMSHRYKALHKLIDYLRNTV